MARKQPRVRGGIRPLCDLVSVGLLGYGCRGASSVVHPTQASRRST